MQWRKRKKKIKNFIFRHVVWFLSCHIRQLYRFHIIPRCNESDDLCQRRISPSRLSLRVTDASTPSFILHCFMIMIMTQRQYLHHPSVYFMSDALLINLIHLSKLTMHCHAMPCCAMSAWKHWASGKCASHDRLMMFGTHSLKGVLDTCRWSPFDLAFWFVFWVSVCQVAI